MNTRTFILSAEDETQGLCERWASILPLRYVFSLGVSLVKDIPIMSISKEDTVLLSQDDDGDDGGDDDGDDGGDDDGDDGGDDDGDDGGDGGDGDECSNVCVFSVKFNRTLQRPVINL